MRSEPGFVLGSDDAAADAADACNAPLISSDEDWAAARPALRLSEVRAPIPWEGPRGRGHVGGATWVGPRGRVQLN